MSRFTHPRAFPFRLAVAVQLAAWSLGCSSVADEPIATTTASLTATDVQPLTLPTNWTSSAWGGSVMTRFADVTGDGRADAIAVNSSNIQVRNSNGSSFASAQTWLSVPFSGSVATFFADVTGDGKADAIAVNGSSILVRRANTGGTAFGSSETWLSAGFSGSAGTFIEDVTGDGKADVIAVNSSDIRVRASSGSAFGSSQTWLTTGFSGNVKTSLVDVTGDGRADVVALNTANILVRRAQPTTGFGTVETWSTTGPEGTITSFMADMTGDGLSDLVEVNTASVKLRRSNRWYLARAETLQGGTYPSLTYYGANVTGGADKRADLVSRSSTAPIVVYRRQNRKIPLRVVQLVASPANVIPDSQLFNVIATANKVFLPANLEFELSVPANHHVVVNAELADISGGVGPVSSEAVMALAKPFNQTCDMGYDDFRYFVRYHQLAWVSARCGKSGEILVYVTHLGTNDAWHPAMGNAFFMDPAGITDHNATTSIFAHEMGHYMGLGHVFGLGFGPAGHVDPIWGQALPLASSWDLVFAPGPIAFNSWAEASAYESSLARIQQTSVGAPSLYSDGWYCPSNDPAKPCPPTPYPPGTAGLSTIGMPVGGNGPVWWSGDQRLQGLSLRNPDDRMNAVNVMSYNYNPWNGSQEWRPQGLSMSQIELIRNHFVGDIPTQILAASGAIIYADRPRLGITGPAPAFTFWSTNGFAKSGPGTLATNGAETWVVGTTAYNADGNQVHRWDIQSRTWVGYAMGAAQIAVASNGGMMWPGYTPWSITNSGAVKRWDGVGFSEPPNSAGACAVSLAPGPTYTWAVGCYPINFDGNRQIYRYRTLDGVGGWVPTTGYAVQVTADQNGVPWARTAQGGVYRANLDAAGMPTATWNYYPLPTGTATSIAAGSHRNFTLPAVALGSNGHIYTRSTAGTWFDAVTPTPSFTQIAGSIPYTWGTDSTGRVWYGR